MHNFHVFTAYPVLLDIEVFVHSLLFCTVVFIGTTLFALQQLSGINAVFYFSSTVFRRAGVPSDFANIFVGLSNLSGTLWQFSVG